MKMKIIVMLMCTLLLLPACGGENAQPAEPATQPPTLMQESTAPATAAIPSEEYLTDKMAALYDKIYSQEEGPKAFRQLMDNAYSYLQYYGKPQQLSEYYFGLEAVVVDDISFTLCTRELPGSLIIDNPFGWAFLCVETPQGHEAYTLYRETYDRPYHFSACQTADGVLICLAGAVDNYERDTFLSAWLYREGSLTEYPIEADITGDWLEEYACEDGRFETRGFGESLASAPGNDENALFALCRRSLPYLEVKLEGGKVTVSDTPWHILSEAEKASNPYTGLGETFETWLNPVYEAFRGAERVSPSGGLLTYEKHYSFEEKDRDYPATLDVAIELPQLAGTGSFARNFNAWYKDCLMEFADNAKPENIETLSFHGDIEEYILTDCYTWDRFYSVVIEHHACYGRNFCAPDIDNFDISTGKQLTYDDVFLGSREEYIAILETRMPQGLSMESGSWHQDWISQQDFIGLPWEDNFLITPRGIGFHYGHGELTSNAAGAQMILLPHEVIADVLNPELFGDIRPDLFPAICLDDSTNKMPEGVEIVERIATVQAPSDNFVITSDQALYDVYIGQGMVEHLDTPFINLQGYCNLEVLQPGQGIHVLTDLFVDGQTETIILSYTTAEGEHQVCYIKPWSDGRYTAVRVKDLEQEYLAETPLNANAILPSGWQFEQVIFADVNGDGLEDVVAALITVLPTVAEYWAQLPLVIWLGQADGSYERVLWKVGVMFSPMRTSHSSLRAGKEYVEVELYYDGGKSYYALRFDYDDVQWDWRLTQLYDGMLDDPVSLGPPPEHLAGVSLKEFNSAMLFNQE